MILYRDSLQYRLELFISQTEQEGRELEKFKELKMGQTLDYNVRLFVIYCM